MRIAAATILPEGSKAKRIEPWALSLDRLRKSRLDVKGYVGVFDSESAHAVTSMGLTPIPIFFKENKGRTTDVFLEILSGFDDYSVLMVSDPGALVSSDLVYAFTDSIQNGFVYGGTKIRVRAAGLPTKYGIENEDRFVGSWRIMTRKFLNDFSRFSLCYIMNSEELPMFLAGHKKQKVMLRSCVAKELKRFVHEEKDLAINSPAFMFYGDAHKRYFSSSADWNISQVMAPKISLLEGSATRHHLIEYPKIGVIDKTSAREPETNLIDRQTALWFLNEDEIEALGVLSM